MKPPSSLILAAVLVGQQLLLAEEPPSPPVAPPPPPPVAAHLDGAQLEAQLKGVNEQVRTQLAHANRAVQLAHATHTKSVAHANRAIELAQAVVERDLVLGEAPEPPPAPEPPEPSGDVFEHIDGSVQLWDLGSGTRIGGPFGGASEPLVVPEGDAPAGVLDETREDLSILSRLLRKAAGRTDDRAEAMGIVIATLPGLRQPQAMYLGGYGALFLLNTPFPLAPAEAVEAKPAEKPSNTDWEEARRELYGPWRAPGVAWAPRAGPPREAAYSAERVARLKRELIEVLKNASNLRHVKDDEQVVVVVNSSSGPGAGTAHAVSVGREVRIERRVARYGGHSTGGQPVVKEVREESSGGLGSTLVLRVKKADAAAFAAGNLGVEEFARRVGVTTY